MSRRKQSRVEELIERAYYASCSGIQINVMDIGKVFAFGRQIIADSEDYESLKSRLRAYVETIRVDRQPEPPSCTFETQTQAWHDWRDNKPGAQRPEDVQRRLSERDHAPMHFEHPPRT